MERFTSQMDGVLLCWREDCPRTPDVHHTIVAKIMAGRKMVKMENGALFLSFVDGTIVDVAAHCWVLFMLRSQHITIHEACRFANNEVQ